MSLFGSIWNDLKYSMRTGHMVTKLVVVNFSVWVFMKLIHLALWLTLGFRQEMMARWYEQLLEWFCLPANVATLAWRPWSLLTHFFLHDSIWHLIHNIFGLLIFGSVVGDLMGNRRVLPIYLLGGLAGALAFLISAQFMPLGGYALGASAAVMAMGGAALAIAPDYRIPLLLFGGVKVKYIVLVLVILDLVAISHSYQSGGPIAHLGGLAMGIWVVYALRKGTDMAQPINNLLDRIRQIRLTAPTPKPATQPARRRPQPGKQPVGASPLRVTKPFAQPEPEEFQTRLDAILEKIKATGFDSLSQEEKEFLYEASKRS